MRRDLEGAKGFLSFEYWQRLESLVLGMHVGWSNADELATFADGPSHRDIARWATKSRLVSAMKLETLAVVADRRIIHLGGFYIMAPDHELPSDSLFPSPIFEEATSAR